MPAFKESQPHWSKIENYLADLFELGTGLLLNVGISTDLHPGRSSVFSKQDCPSAQISPVFLQVAIEAEISFRSSQTNHSQRGGILSLAGTTSQDFNLSIKYDARDSTNSEGGLPVHSGNNYKA
jgi:hypothetical protein